MQRLASIFLTAALLTFPVRAGVKEDFAQAIALAKSGKLAESLPILDGVLKAAPNAAKARLIRGKVRFRLGKYEDAQDDVEQVVKEAPATAGAKELLAEIRKHVKPPSVTITGGAAKYSEREWSWKVPAEKPFELAEFKGAEGHTLFVWPARPGDAGEVEAYEHESSDQNLYYLRVVNAKGADGNADLTLPGAKAHGVTVVPYMLLMDESGATVARGAPAEVLPKLDPIKKAALAKRKPAEPVTHMDFSTDVQTPESLGQSGYTTVVMVTSPG